MKGLKITAPQMLEVFKGCGKCEDAEIISYSLEAMELQNVNYKKEIKCMKLS